MPKHKAAESLGLYLKDMQSSLGLLSGEMTDEQKGYVSAPLLRMVWPPFIHFGSSTVPSSLAGPFLKLVSLLGSRCEEMWL